MGSRGFFYTPHTPSPSLNNYPAVLLSCPLEPRNGFNYTPLICKFLFSPKLTNASFVLVFKLLLQLSPFSTIAHETPSVVAPFHGQPVHTPPCAPGSQQLSAPPVGRQTRPSHLLPTSRCFLDPVFTSPRWKKSSSSFLSSGSWEGGFENWKVCGVWILLSLDG